MLLDKAVLPPAQEEGRKGCLSPLRSNALRTIYHIQKAELNLLYSENSNAISLL